MKKKVTRYLIFCSLNKYIVSVLLGLGRDAHRLSAKSENQNLILCFMDVFLGISPDHKRNTYMELILLPFQNTGFMVLILAEVIEVLSS